jgi:hypothetical protein
MVHYHPIMAGENSKSSEGVEFRRNQQHNVGCPATTLDWTVSVPCAIGSADTLHTHHVAPQDHYDKFFLALCGSHLAVAGME